LLTGNSVYFGVQDSAKQLVKKSNTSRGSLLGLDLHINDRKEPKPVSWHKKNHNPSHDTVPLHSLLIVQDSLHVSQLAAQERAAAAAAAAAKKKGLKSSLGRIFGGKKEKGLKSRVVGVGGGGGGAASHYVTAPLSLGAGGHTVYMGDSEMVSSESMAGLGGLAGKGDFDRRKKKK
jgi:hypothetical protein